MKVELKIKDDKELRNTIKDMIRSQVKSIIRVELNNIIKNELEKIFEKDKKLIEKEYNSAYVIFKKSINDFVKSDKPITSLAKEVIDLKLNKIDLKKLVLEDLQKTVPQILGIVGGK